MQENQTENNDQPLQLPPTDLPQMPNAGQGGAVANLASPDGTRKAIIAILATIIVGAIGVAIVNIIMVDRDTKLDEQLATDVRTSQSNLVEAQDSAWNAVKPETIPVSGKSFTDDYGYTVTVNQVIRNFKAPTAISQWDITDAGKKQIVLVEYTISRAASKAIGVSPQALTLMLKSDDEPIIKLTLNSLNTAMSDAGHTVLKVEDIKEGDSVTGFVPYALDKDAPLVVVYHANKSITSIGTPVIPAKDYELPIY